MRTTISCGAADASTPSRRTRNAYHGLGLIGRFSGLVTILYSNGPMRSQALTRAPLNSLSMRTAPTRVPEEPRASSSKRHERRSCTGNVSRGRGVPFARSEDDAEAAGAAGAAGVAGVSTACPKHAEPRLRYATNASSRASARAESNTWVRRRRGMRRTSMSATYRRVWCLRHGPVSLHPDRADRGRCVDGVLPLLEGQTGASTGDLRHVRPRDGRPTRDAGVDLRRVRFRSHRAARSALLPTRANGAHARGARRCHASPLHLVPRSARRVGGPLHRTRTADGPARRASASCACSRAHDGRR